MSDLALAMSCDHSHLAMEREIQDAVDQALTRAVMSATRKLSEEFLRALVEDQHAAFGEDSVLFRQALLPRTREEYDIYRSIKKASRQQLSKALGVTIFEQQLGNRRTREAILSELGIDRHAIEKETAERVRQDWKGKKEKR